MGALKKVLANVAWIGLCITGYWGFVLPVSAQTAAEPAGQSAVMMASSSRAADNSVTAGELLESPGATVAEAGSAPTFRAAQDQQQAATASQSATPSQTSQRKPVGTAAAEAPNATGVAASQPAGVAIAPGKQHRARTIVIRMGAILGAGAAVGTVVALTAATPSKPPGAH
jgi:hypothetical protein